MATESGMAIPPPPTLPDDDNNNNKDSKPATNDNNNNNNTEPPRKRMKVDQPQVPHYNSHNIYSRPTTLPQSTQQQPTSLPTIHEPVTPLFDDDNNNNNNNNSLLFGAELAPLPEATEKWPVCAYCGKNGDLSRCSSCRQAYYCNRECQVAHWDVHSIVCQPGPPQPPQLPDISGGQPIPQPTTTYNYNNYNRSPTQYSSYNNHNGYPSHHQTSHNYSQHNGISHRSAHDYDPPPRAPRRRNYNNYADNDGNKEQYYCEECDRYFKNGQALGGHRSRVHSSRRNGGSDPNLPPDHRNPSATRKRRPRASRARHEPSGDGQYVCPHCGREFRTGNALGGHISGAHTKKSKRMAARNDDHPRYARPRHPNI